MGQCDRPGVVHREDAREPTQAARFLNKLGRTAQLHALVVVVRQGGETQPDARQPHGCHLLEVLPGDQEVATGRRPEEAEAEGALVAQAQGPRHEVLAHRGQVSCPRPTLLRRHGDLGVATETLDLSDTLGGRAHPARSHVGAQLLDRGLAHRGPVEVHESRPQPGVVLRGDRAPHELDAELERKRSAAQDEVQVSLVHVWFFPVRIKRVIDLFNWPSFGIVFVPNPAHRLPCSLA